MTQPLCAYRDENGDVCGKIEKDSRYRHAVLRGDAITMLNHEFQPQSTGESAPVKECSHCKGLKEIRVSDESVMACPFCVPCDWGCSKTMYCVSCRIHTPKPAAKTGAQGAVPGPQDALIMDCLEIWGDITANEISLPPKVVRFVQNVWNLIDPMRLATPEPHSPPITSGYVQEVLPDDAEGPSCHVCGAEMVPNGRLEGRIFVRENYVCQSCGATTGCTPAEEPRKVCTNMASKFIICGEMLGNKPALCKDCRKLQEGSIDSRPQERVTQVIPCKGDSIVSPVPSVDERLTEIAERESKATPDWEQKGDTIIRKSDKHPNGVYVAAFGCGKTSWPQSVSDTQFAAHARADIPYLLRLVTELRQERDEYRRKWNDVLKHEDKALAMCRRLQARAEQAERERDELKLKLDGK